MKVAIMQPYFFPYIGYFQLINTVDFFVIYDNIEYTKKGWINRNRILVNNKDCVFTLPLKKDSDFLNVNQRELSDNWNSDKIKLLLISPFASWFMLNIFEDCLQLRSNCAKEKLFTFLSMRVGT